jgi:hypothetical protein
VAEFTLAENPANTTTSLLQQQCQPDGSAVLLHPDLQDSDYYLLQQQLLPNSAAGSGALEHDPCSLYALGLTGLTGPRMLGMFLGRFPWA